MPPLSLLRNGEEYKGELSTYIGRWADLYWSDDEAILVRRRSYIGRDGDLYRMAKKTI